MVVFMVFTQVLHIKSHNWYFYDVFLSYWTIDETKLLQIIIKLLLNMKKVLVNVIIKYGLLVYLGRVA